MSKKIEAYHILFSQNSLDLTAKVNDMIIKGWVPQGGLTTVISPEYNESVMAQAMIMYSLDGK